MRIISVNTNGIRSAAKKGFFDWLKTQDADVVCIQETKARIEQLEDDPVFFPEGYHCYYEDATSKKGYSGVALYCRQEPDELIRGFGDGFEEFDAEGRYLEARFGKLAVASIYVPSGSSSEERQAAKFRFMDLYMPRLKAQAGDDVARVVCGDWNIAHKEIDLKNWRGNRKNSGFLPEERAWLDELYGPAGWVDAFRVIDDRDEQYTWWSNRGQAWAKNVGWRIDYHVITQGLADKVTSASIYKDARFSDHAPLTIEYDVAL
ncbi:MAG: exodeoxyribonuclease III [Gammaproteobacteria bacterium]|nr:exodeoxyribonuclease III [Gammaproteobacteria bacterium]MCP5136432.1 exodeoxyribonuclease III [Gammaproteobacteria bacterium]